MSYILFLFLAPMAAVLSIGTALLIWRERQSIGAKYLVLLLALVTSLLVVKTFELLDPIPQGTLILARAGFVFWGLIPLVWIAFALDYTGQQQWLKPGRFIFFAFIPLVSIGMIISDNSHHLVYETYHFEIVRSFMLVLIPETWGAWFWVHTLCCYSFLFLGAFLIIQTYSQNPVLFRQQTFIIILGALAPLVGNILYLFQIIPRLEQDFTSILLAMASIAYVVGVTRYHLFDLVPIAQLTLMQNMVEGVLVLDTADRVVDINPVALKIMGRSHPGEVIGKSIDEIPGFWKNILKRGVNQPSFQTEASLTYEGMVLYYDIHVTCLTARNGGTLGRLMTIHDITERVLLMHELQKIAHLDPLLGVNNRRHFYELAQREFDRASRTNRPLSILMLDLDHFKQVNDLHGHKIGDQALLGFSRVLKQSLRSMDVVARFGGDEFVVLLPETDTQHAHHLAERLRNDLKSAPIYSDIGPLSLTFSVGISSLNGSEESLDVLFERADRALYHSKNQGRDQATILSDN